MVALNNNKTPAPIKAKIQMSLEATEYSLNTCKGTS